MADQNGDSDVEESRLGRQEYWEETYQQELVNLRELDDEGEVWYAGLLEQWSCGQVKRRWNLCPLSLSACRFGSDVLETMASWTDELLKSRSPDSAALAILDVGTGNGSFLFKLAQRGYRQLTGSDYSAASIQLAAEIAARRRVDTITWVQDDLLAAQLSGRSAFIRVVNNLVCGKNDFFAICNLNACHYVADLMSSQTKARLML